MPSPSQRTEPWQFPGRQEVVRKPSRDTVSKGHNKQPNAIKPNRAKDRKFPQWAQ